MLVVKPGFPEDLPELNSVGDIQISTFPCSIHNLFGYVAQYQNIFFAARKIRQVLNKLTTNSAN